MALDDRIALAIPATSGSIRPSPIVGILRLLGRVERRRLPSRAMNDRDRLQQLLDDPGEALTAGDPALRRIAVAATLTHPELHRHLITMLAEDESSEVRRESAEVLGRSAIEATPELELALADPVVEVREAAATALGERQSAGSVALLIERAEDEKEDRLVREAAVASLGAIGDYRALPVLLALIETAPPQVRRRCVPALSVFDGDEVEAALRAAAKDRNPMVREAAEMVVGRASS